MQYYTDGGLDLIRIVAPDNVTGPWLTEQPSHRYYGAAKGGWEPSPIYNLAVVALFSGDYYPITEAQADEIMAEIDGEKATR
ncbi:hypothetical protein ACGFK1_11765 [Mycobacterium sp. NPDC048908]|uniref:hypothetical protein n=1 Tax=Mycobacterium sp. NPDC048908 TaxID=3364292 RepID=UPI00371C46B0